MPDYKKLLYRWRLCAGCPINDKHGPADYVADLPSAPGLYAIWSYPTSGRPLECLYVGKSDDIRNRFSGGNHHVIERATAGGFGGISVCHPEPYLLEAVEGLLIKELNPKLNGRFNRRALLTKSVKAKATEVLERIDDFRLAKPLKLDFAPADHGKETVSRLLKKRGLVAVLGLKNFGEAFDPNRKNTEDELLDDYYQAQKQFLALPSLYAEDALLAAKSELENYYEFIGLNHPSEKMKELKAKAVAEEVASEAAKFHALSSDSIGKPETESLQLTLAI